MNAIKLVFRRLFRKGENTTTRIISSTAGLAFGILLLSEVFYYYSFDSFYPDANRIYIVHENFKVDKSSDKTESHLMVSGAIDPGLKAEVPGIEAATRLNSIGTQFFIAMN
jgi:putative ABC transport system permease protein